MKKVLILLIILLLLICCITISFKKEVVENKISLKNNLSKKKLLNIDVVSEFKGETDDKKKLGK